MNNHQPTISIIVPVYQAEAYLKTCVDSVLSQTFSDFELILIDDGSQDESGNICDDYLEADSRVRVFHQENKGLSAVRNAGIKYAQGEYIMMLDADDVLLDCNYIMILYSAAIEHNARVSICKIQIIREVEALSSLCCGKPDIQIVSGSEIYSGNPLYKDFLRFNAVWAKLYHKTCFSDIVFPEGRFYEDVAVMHQILFPCERIALVQMEMHGYRVNPNGITRGSKLSLLYCDMVMALRERMNYFAEREAIVQYEAAKEIYKKYSVRVFLGLVEKDCIDEVPEEMWPDVSDFRKYHVGSFNFKRVVLDYNSSKHRKYFDNLFSDCFSDAIQLLQIINNVIKSEYRSCEKTGCITYNDAEHMLAYAHDRKLLYPFAEYIAKFYVNKDSDLYKLCVEHQTHLIREHIQYEHAVGKIIKAAEKSGIMLIPVMDSVLDSKYAKPWYRSRSRSVLLMPQSEADCIGIDQVMRDAGFSLSPNNDNKNEILQTWENRGNIKISISTDISSGMNPDAGCYFQEVCRSMLNEKRSMNEIECAAFLISKIESHDNTLWTTNLADYYDLYCLLHEGNIERNREFSRLVRELSLLKTFSTIRSLNAKIFDVCQEKNIYDSQELKMLLSVV